MYTQLELIKSLSKLTQQAEMRKLVSLFFFFFFFFCLRRSLVPFVKSVAEHLLSWPPFRWPGRRVHETERVKEKHRGYVCVCVSCVLGRGAVQLLGLSS